MSEKAQKETEEMLNPVICEACGKTYDYYTEPAEVKEGGTHVCPECWATDE